jgi:hypothetical protein
MCFLEVNAFQDLIELRINVLGKYLIVSEITTFPSKSNLTNWHRRYKIEFAWKRKSICVLGHRLTV